MTRRTSLAALWLVAGCQTYEGLPSGAEGAPETVPEAALAVFDFETEARVLTRACVASEISGPAQLQQLLGQGYVLTRTFGQASYARQAPSPGGLLAGATRISASDPNDRLACAIRVEPYTRTEALLPVVADEMGRLGYRRVEVPLAGGRTVTRFVGAGQRFIVDGSTTTGPGLAYGEIEVSRVDASGDLTCRTEGLTDALREGCDGAG